MSTAWHLNKHNIEEQKGHFTLQATMQSLLICNVVTNLDLEGIQA